MYTKDIFIVINILTILLLCFSAMFVFFINILLCMALFALLLAATISFGIFLKKSSMDTRYKKHVLFSRVISIITAAAIIFPMAMCMGFNNNKACHGLKLCAFSYGGQNIMQNRVKALPKKLPKNCDNYRFRLGHGLKKMEFDAASAFVKFSTDNDTLVAYEAEFIEKGYKQLSPDFTFEDFLRKNKIKEDEILEYYETMNLAITNYLVDIGVPWYLDGHLNDKTFNLSYDVIVYDFSEKLGFSAGCILDYTNGIVIFWA